MSKYKTRFQLKCQNIYIQLKFQNLKIPNNIQTSINRARSYTLRPQGGGPQAKK